MDGAAAPPPRSARWTTRWRIWSCLRWRPEFGEDFDLAAFQTAYDSQDPVELNRVKAVERGVDQLYNYIAELAAFGLELADVRARRDATNAVSISTRSSGSQ